MLRAGNVFEMLNSSKMSDSDFLTSAVQIGVHCSTLTPSETWATFNEAAKASGGSRWPINKNVRGGLSDAAAI